MTRIEWKPEYSVGDAEEDFEHEQLLGQVDVLYEQLSGRLDKETVKAIFDEMYAGISAHFAVEENLMRETDFGEYDKHKEDHEKLLGQILGLRDSFTQDAEAGRKLLHDRLSDWFSLHFTSFDVRWHNLLN